MPEDSQDVFDYEYDDETGAVEVNMLGSVYGPSIEDYSEVMSRVINILQEVPEATTVVLSESREYEYGEDQTRMIKEISQLIRNVSNQGVLSETRNSKCRSLYQENLPEVQRIVVDKMRKDPVGAYVKLKRKRRHMKQESRETYPERKRCIKYFIQDVVDPVMTRMEETSMIQQAKDGNYLTGHHVGDREVYREFFHPVVRPNFMLTKYMSLPPERGEEVERYTVDQDVEISIYDVPNAVQPVYHVDPPEFRLSEEKYQLLDAARRFLASHQPESGEFARPERMRQVFQNIGKDMLRDVADRMEVKLTQNELDQLTGILNRYTSGLGVLELLLADQKIQDIYLNSPIGESPIYVKHMDYEECKTNLIPTREEAESYATRFRIKSGRPLDEANPVLDTDTEVPGGRARVAIVQENLSPEGLAFTFRRHRSKAWTLPLFMDNGMINSMGAALLSFIVDGNRSVLFAGTRGAGKSSMLSASLLEILKKHRIITVEDTLELPVRQMKDLGYNLESLKARSAITNVENELSAEEAIRTSLRLGDSALVVGEVRSEEAKALYEAMRVGAAANFVGGTIHGDDPYSVYDWVVNDLGVPSTSFKATDIIVSANKIKSPDGLNTYRRITGITEVRKDWQNNPQEEDAFVDLMRYDSNKDELVPTDTFLNGESEILQRIAENIREYKNNWEKVFDNIKLRQKVKEEIVKKANEEDKPELMEAEFSVKANQQMHLLSQKVFEEYGQQDSDRIFARWQEWMEQQV
jgi:type IV secretory pathway ATPase VirB11/archaellum biosynthesis ATPase